MAILTRRRHPEKAIRKVVSSSRLYPRWVLRFSVTKEANTPKKTRVTCSLGTHKTSHLLIGHAQNESLAHWARTKRVTCSLGTHETSHLLIGHAQNESLAHWARTKRVTCSLGWLVHSNLLRLIWDGGVGGGTWVPMSYHLLATLLPPE